MKSVKNTNWKNQARGKDGRFTSVGGPGQARAGSLPKDHGRSSLFQGGPGYRKPSSVAGRLFPTTPAKPKPASPKRNKPGGSTSSNGVKRVQGTRNIGGEPFFQTNRGSGGKLTPDQKKMVGATKVQGVQMSEAAQAQYLRLTGGSSAGYGAQWMKIRAINQTNPKLTPAERRALGDNLPTSTMGKKLLAKNIVDTKRARQSAQYR